MSIEDEVKLDVDLHFVAPQIALGDGIEAIEISPEVRTVTVYFDTGALELAKEKVALRFRYRIAHLPPSMPADDLVSPASDQIGVWALKSKGEVVVSDGVSTTAREEVEVTATFGKVPAELVGAYGRISELKSRLEVIAAMDARRSVRKIISGTKAVVEIDDDVVTILRGATAGETFREIEFELLDPGFSRLRARLVEAFRAAGADYSKAGSKLERALTL